MGRYIQMVEIRDCQGSVIPVKLSFKNESELRCELKKSIASRHTLQEI